MQYVRLGRSGLKVSRLALGCMSFGSSGWQPWVLDESASVPILERALDLGINFFDTADFYSLGESEVIVGKVLKRLRKRHEAVIATKAYWPMSGSPNDRGLSRKHLYESVDASLKRLGTDYIDLFLIHRFDYETPLEETLDALNDLVRAGKILYLGASSMHAWQFMKALGLQRKNGWAEFVAMQPHYNLIYREEEREMLPLCRSEGVGVIPWSPLARGLLAGRKPGAEGATVRERSDAQHKHLYGSTAEQDRLVIEALARVSERHGRPAAQVAYAWVGSRPGITAPIVGLTKLAQLEDAVASLDIQLTDEDVAELEMHYRPKAVAGHV